MLMQRVITAAILAPAVIGAILFLPTWATSSIFGVFLVIGVLEWNKLAGMQPPLSRVIALIFAGLAIGLYMALQNPEVRVFCFVIAVATWLLITAFVISTQHTGKTSLHSLPGRIFNGPLACLVILLGAFASTVELLKFDPAILLLLFVAVWAADAGAYFTGKALGKRKLAVNISPGKTWEGVIGGLVLSALVMAAGVQLLLLSDAQKHALIALGVVAVCFSVVGDLFESILKRHGRFKDSGNLLPGHGGALDRVDGLIAAVSIFAAGYFLWVSKL